MKTTILNSDIEKPHYKLTVKFMLGDADGYVYSTQKFTPKEVAHDSFGSLIATLDGLIEAYPYGRGGGGQDDYKYRECNYYDTFFSSDVVDTLPEDFEKRVNPLNLWVEQQYDSTGDCDADFQSYTFEYYGPSGRYFPVEFELTEDELNITEEVKNHYN